MDKKNAIISVVSMHKEHEKEKIEVVTPGKFYKKNNAYFAVYNETEISGMEGTTTTLKISPDNISIIRFGTTSTTMHFKNKSKDIALYNTPYGTLELQFKTNNIDIKIDDDGGDALIDYNLGLVGEKTQNTLLKINVKVKH